MEKQRRNLRSANMLKTKVNIKLTLTTQLVNVKLVTNLHQKLESKELKQRTNSIKKLLHKKLKNLMRELINNHNKFIGGPNNPLTNIITKKFNRRK